MHAFRSALTTCQRQLSAPRAFSAAATATASAVPVLSAAEWMDNIKKSAEKDVLIKKTKLASFLKTVTTSEELEASKEIMKIYEQKRVDPDSNAAGLFVKKALELNAANVVFEVLEANYRIGLFLEPTTLNKLLSKFFKDGDFEKVFQLHEIGSQKYHVKSTERTYDILIRAAIEQEDLDKAVALLKTAAESHKLQRVTCNNLLFKLKEGEQAEKIEEVAALMKAAGVEPNETTRKILQ
ncbi:hypothetical protein Gpo141_00007654 [Globisporangium polare]